MTFLVGAKIDKNYLIDWPNNIRRWDTLHIVLHSALSLVVSIHFPCLRYYCVGVPCSPNLVAVWYTRKSKSTDSHEAVEVLIRLGRLAFIFGQISVHVSHSQRCLKCIDTGVGTILLIFNFIDVLGQDNRSFDCVGDEENCKFPICSFSFSFQIFSKSLELLKSVLFYLKAHISVLGSNTWLETKPERWNVIVFNLKTVCSCLAIYNKLLYKDWIDSSWLAFVGLLSFVQVDTKHLDKIRNRKPNNDLELFRHNNICFSNVRTVAEFFRWISCIADDMEALHWKKFTGTEPGTANQVHFLRPIVPPFIFFFVLKLKLRVGGSRNISF